MANEHDPFQSPIETRNRHSIDYTKEHDALGMPVVTKLSFTNHYTSVIVPGTEDQKAALRHALVSHEVGNETIKQAELREEALPKLSETAARYSMNVGIDQQRNVNNAMSNMGQNMIAQGLAQLHEFTKQVDDQMEGRVRSQFAAPKHEVDARETPHHGGVPNAGASNGPRQI